MSFGFSVGDFLAIIELANKIRKDFASAPKQFQDISVELRNLEYAVRDIDIFISGNDITDTQKKDLGGIRDSCQDVLKDCQHLVSNYSALESPVKGLKGRTTRAWQRLTSEPNDVRDLRDRITSNVTQLNRFNEGFTRDNVVRLVKVQDEFVKRQGQQDHQEILDWLTPIDFAAQQSDFIRRRQSGTGQWLLDSPEYRKWVESRKGALFCPGIPGAGKTILSSIAVENLQDNFHGDSSIGICYAYCNFRRSDEQKLDDLFASLVKQLAQGQSPFPGSVKDLYGRHKERRTRPSTDDLSRTLHSVVATFSRVFILVDALDECTSSDGCRSRLISELQKLQADLGANILATSRFIPEITARFKEAVQLEIRASESDISTYLNGNLSHLPGFVSRNLQLQAEIKQSIIKCVDGMFLLAQLHLESLKGKRSPKAVRVALKKLANGSNAYDIAYHDAMTRINAQISDQKLLAHQTLSWVICAKRPLKTIELEHALAVEPGEPDLDEDNLPDLQDMVSNCCGLVTIDDESGIVRLIHYTTQEYFERTWKDWFPDAQSEITETCTTYLAFDVFESGPCQSDLDFEKRLFAYPLYHYASHHWGNHAYWVLEGSWWPALLSNHSKVEAAVQGLLARQTYAGEIGYSQKFPKKMTGLHIGAFFGLYNPVAALIQPENVNGPDSDGRIPLSYAASNGYEAVVRLLLDHKAEVASKAMGTYNAGKTPLSFAASNGHEAVVRLLLQHGSEVDSKATGIFNTGRTPLFFAASNGHEAVVRLLLQHGSEVDLKVTEEYNAGRTPLSFAASNGHEAVVRLLLQHGSEVDSKATEKYDAGRTPLSFAASNGHEAVVRLLLQHGSEVDSKTTGIYDPGRTPLLIATLNGHEAVVRLLLENKAQVGSKDQYDRSPLVIAVEYEREALVRLLLQYMAEIGSEDLIDSTNEDGMSLLSIAAENGQEAVVRLLLENQAKVDSKDRDGRTPLSYAAKNGHEAVVRLLLENKAQVGSKDQYGRSPLLMAAENEGEAVVRLLLQYIAEIGLEDLIDSTDEDGMSPLSIAAENGQEAVVRLLLENKAKVDSKDRDGKTPLSIAALYGHAAVVHLLLEYMVEIDSKDQIDSKDLDGRTPLSFAASNGYISVIRLLLDYGAQPWLHDSCKRPPLFYAIQRDSVEVFDLLIQSNKSEINMVDYYGSTSLSIAARFGNGYIVERILGIASVDVNIVDDFGRSPLWWAQKLGHNLIAEHLLKHSSPLLLGELRVGVVDETIDESPYTLHLGNGSCDVCFTGLGKSYYFCAKCHNDGKFAICSGCHDKGASCLDGSHKLSRWPLQSGRGK
ncbi:hypothetical protein PG995_003346 [Apiospora arundinis]